MRDLRRDQLLLGLLAAPAALRPARVEAATESARIVVLDWALASTLVALGIVPVGVAEPDLYRHWVGEPSLPAQTRDIGLRLEPNLEAVAGLAPNLILTSPFNAAARPRLETIAPVLELAVFTADREPLKRATEIALNLGGRLGREAEAKNLLALSQAAFDEARTKFAGGSHPLLLASFIDRRHLNLYGRGSLFDAVLKELGLANAWEGSTNIWGLGVVPMEELARFPAADLVIIEPIPADVAVSLSRPGLWASLKKTRTGRTLSLPPAWAFGDLTAATRFAGLLSRRLAEAEAAQ